MDTLQLRLFLSLSKTLNFTKTANEFFMSQPNVSNYIKSLERNLGVKLLNRDSRSVSLTEEGREFVEYASQLIKIQTEAENRLRNISEGRRGYIKIAMLSSAAELFSECLTEFSTKHPDVQVDVDIKEGVELIKAIALSSYDIYFANNNMIPSNESVEHIAVGSEHLHLFMHREMAKKIKIDMSDWSVFTGFRFVSVPETDFALSEQVKNICANRGITPDVINYYNRADTALLAVNSGIGMTILPPQLKYFFKLPNVTSLPIDGDDAIFETVVAWHKNKVNPAARNFLKLSAMSGNR